MAPPEITGTEKDHRVVGAGEMGRISRLSRSCAMCPCTLTSSCTSYLSQSSTSSRENEFAAPQRPVWSLSGEGWWQGPWPDYHCWRWNLVKSGISFLKSALSADYNTNLLEMGVAFLPPNALLLCLLLISSKFRSEELFLVSLSKVLIIIFIFLLI